jgi:hypothetical protein
MVKFAWRIQGRPHRRRRMTRWVVLAMALLAPVRWVRATDGDKSDAPKTLDPAAVQQLMLEVEELRARVKELESRMGSSGAPAQPALAVPAAVGAAAAATVAAAPAVLPVSPATGDGGATVAAAPSAATPNAPVPQEPDPGSGTPNIKLHLFGDSGFHDSTVKGDTDTFYIGSLDMLMTGNLTDRTSVLAEVLYTSESDNSINPDVERMLLQYKANDYFIFAVGRYHTSIGYYNPTFHRGEWFQTAIGRPYMYAFDDNGGNFPLQEIGVTTSGQIPSGKFGLQYVAEIGNGRNHTFGAEPAQNFQDINNGKSVNFALSSRPSFVSGLDMGFSIYHDHISSADNIDHDEVISTVHVVYTNSNYEFLNEASLTRHTGAMEGGPGLFHTPGFYTQISRKFGKYCPYFRYQYFNAGVAEPIYGDPEDGTVSGRRNSANVGVRWDFNNHAAWKLQYDRLDRRGTDTVSDRTITKGNGIETEFSFAF